ncbi:MAG: hypothetical protein ACI4GW_13820, partial [Lachnospiraceae bacterium]
MNTAYNVYVKIAIIILIVIYIIWPLMKKVKKIIQRQIRYKKYLDSPLASVDRMKGDEFEEYLAVHFR